MPYGSSISLYVEGMQAGRKIFYETDGVGFCAIYEGMLTITSLPLNLPNLDGLRYEKFLLGTDTISSVAHVVTYPQELPHLKMIASKSSEALLPDTVGNHVGEGGTFDNLVNSQPDIRFMVNGTFNHYRKSFYEWPHTGFEVGDPVGFVKIREHMYEDSAYGALNGFLCRIERHRWVISSAPMKGSKYVVNGRPLLIDSGVPVRLPLEELQPVASGVVNPPSFLGHGLQNHARTAVGVNSSGDLVFIVVEGEGVGRNTGIDLLGLQEFGVHLHLASLLNLDGGGSSRFWLKAGDGTIITSSVAEEDEDRVLGHSLMLFSKNLVR